MRIRRHIFPLILRAQHCMPCLFKLQRFYHDIPFFDFYYRITGKTISKNELPKLKRKHPNLDTVSQEQLQSTLLILQKFGITPLEACQNLHLFSMNPISLDNYGEILKECGFPNVTPEYILRYHTIVRLRTISHLKKHGILRPDHKIDELIYNCFKEWPENQRNLKVFPETSTSIMAVRVYILEQYLQWRLSVTEKDFQTYCRNYLPLKHRPMSDIKEALNIAQNDIKFDVHSIRRNGFIISSDPVNTKLILENVNSLAGLDIREAIRIEPAILKNNYISLLKIKQTLEEFQITNEMQRHCMRVFCMHPGTVQERLQQLSELKEYEVLFTNPRVLSLVVHKVKVMQRLEKIQEARKQCYSLNHLLASTKVFDSYISNFGNKACGRDIGILISSSLNPDKIKTEIKSENTSITQSDLAKIIQSKLKKHKYWLHTALNGIHENIRFLKQYFDDNVILNNCYLLLYPVAEIKHYLEYWLKRRDNKLAGESDVELDPVYNTLSYKMLTDDQLLSLVLYEIEKKHHFSGDGVWNKQHRLEAEEHSQQAQQNYAV